MAALYATVDMHRLAIGHGRPNPKPSGELDAVDLIKVLLAHGADPNARLEAPLFQRHHTAGDRALGEGSTPFMRAAKSGDVAVMRMLLAAGADPKLTQAEPGERADACGGPGLARRQPGGAVIRSGLGEGRHRSDQAVLESGLDINATTSNGETALHAAITGRASEPIVRFLVEHGAD